MPLSIRARLSTKSRKVALILGADRHLAFFAIETLGFILFILLLHRLLLIVFLRHIWHTLHPKRRCEACLAESCLEQLGIKLAANRLQHLSDFGGIKILHIRYVGHGLSVRICKHLGSHTASDQSLLRSEESCLLVHLIIVVEALLASLEPLLAPASRVAPSSISSSSTLSIRTLILATLLVTLFLVVLPLLISTAWHISPIRFTRSMDIILRSHLGKWILARLGFTRCTACCGLSLRLRWLARARLGRLSLVLLLSLIDRLFRLLLGWHLVIRIFENFWLCSNNDTFSLFI